MAVQSVFARREIKYLISKEQKEYIKFVMAEYMSPDEFGKSTICSIYYDTPTHMLIRRSQESPIYKEKLRLRSYGVANDDSTAYVEIKKKFKGIVYKRRVGLMLHDAEAWLAGAPPRFKKEPTVRQMQIAREVEFFLSRYDGIIPAMFIGCEREAFYAKDDREFRVTFDENILARDWDLTLDKGFYGEKLLDDDTALMELKAGGALPLWMAELLSDKHIFKTKFSKYGRAYRSGIAHAEEFIL